jgi:hypothetical protein
MLGVGLQYTISLLSGGICKICFRVEKSLSRTLDTLERGAQTVAIFVEDGCRWKRRAFTENAYAFCFALNRFRCQSGDSIQLIKPLLG